MRRCWRRQEGSSRRRSEHRSRAGPRTLSRLELMFFLYLKLFRIWTFGVCLVKVSNCVLHVREKVSGYPGGRVVSVLVAFPGDEISNLTFQPVIDPRVEDLGDFVLVFVVDLDWRWWSNFTVRNCAREVRLELRNMKNGMDATHVRRELESDGVGSRASDNLVRTKVLLGELLGRALCLYKLSK